jgi:hypothetical protein
LPATPLLNPYGVRSTRFIAKIAWSTAPPKKMPEQNSAVFDVGRIELIFYGTNGVRFSASHTPPIGVMPRQAERAAPREGAQRRKQ